MNEGHHNKTNQQRNYTNGCKDLNLQIAQKMLQRGSTSRSHYSCILVCRRHLYELGIISIELISRGLQGCAEPKHIVSLLMVDYHNILHGMARTRVCGLLYQTTTSRSEIPLTDIQVAGLVEEGEWNHI
jgi:hypothetical protein